MLTFVLSHVNASHELDVDLPMFLNDARWAAALGVMYWLQSVASRTITIDAAASRETNFGFNTRDLIVFAFAVLAAGLVVVIRQMNGLSPTGWAVLGPLLAFRFLFDLSLGLRHARERT